MTNAVETVNALEDLTEIIENAMRKVNSKKEADLCHYLPGDQGYLHHFSFKKMKKTRPNDLKSLIEQHIIETDSPCVIAPKPRTFANTKRGGGIQFKRSQVSQLLNILKQVEAQIPEAKELISVLTPPQTLAQVQKLMISMVRSKIADQALWEKYSRLLAE